MLWLIVCNLISFHHLYKIDRNDRDIDLNISFGFLLGGNYSFKITDGENDDYLFMVGTSHEIYYFNDNQDLYHPCTANFTNNNFHVVHLNDGKAQFSGIIEKKGNYEFHIKSCKYFSGGFKLDLTCMNPNSYLPLTQMYYVKATPFIAMISSVLLIIWIVNWIFHFSFRNIIHTLLTILFLLFTIEKYLLIFVEKSSIISDSFSKWLIIQIYIYSLREFFIFLTFNLISLGFEIFDTPIKCFWFVIAFFSPLSIASSSICYIYSYTIYLVSISISIALSIIICFIEMCHFICYLDKFYYNSFWHIVLDQLHMFYLVKKMVFLLIKECSTIIPIELLIVNDVIDFIILAFWGFILRMTKRRETNYYELTEIRNSDINNQLLTHNMIYNRRNNMEKSSSRNCKSY